MSSSEAAALLTWTTSQRPLDLSCGEGSALALGKQSVMEVVQDDCVRSVTVDDRADVGRNVGGLAAVDPFAQEGSVFGATAHVVWQVVAKQVVRCVGAVVQEVIIEEIMLLRREF